MTNSVFSVEVFSRNRFKDYSFIIDKDSLKFSSKSVKTFQEFKESWGQQALVVTQAEIKFSSIISISKTEGSENIGIHYKNAAGIKTNYIFRFKSEDDYATFIDYLTNEKRYKMENDTLSPLYAIRDGLILTLVTVGFTMFSFYYAQSKSVTEGSRGGMLGIYRLLLSTIGDKGVLVLGLIVIGLIVFRSVRVFKNPKKITRLTPTKK